MRNCTMNYKSFLLPRSLHFMFAKRKAKQDPQSWWNCTYTEGAAAANTFSHCPVCVTRGLALVRLMSLNWDIICLTTDPASGNAREKNLETRV